MHALTLGLVIRIYVEPILFGCACAVAEPLAVFAVWEYMLTYCYHTHTVIVFQLGTWWMYTGVWKTKYTNLVIKQWTGAWEWG